MSTSSPASPKAPPEHRPDEARRPDAAMRTETPEQTGPLRQGLTTGACATAAALVAGRCLLTGDEPRSVEIELPRGGRPLLYIENLAGGDDAVQAEVIKDAGDDPDATHGARVWVRLALREESGIAFAAGAGVGTVTRAGLPIAVGEPAINPVPRDMISHHLTELAAETGYDGGFHVTVGIDRGEELARHTMNARLGIVGGLSILGTSGIVRPFSCAAFIASIHEAVDVARASGITHLSGCTGGVSENFVRAHYGLDDVALIEMGDLFGALLKYLRRHPLPQLTLACGVGKLSKFAAGHPDTHSRKCAIDFDFLAGEAKTLGADGDLQQAVRQANTSIEAMKLCGARDIRLGEHLADQARQQAQDRLSAHTQVDVCAVDREGDLVGYAGGTA